MNNALKYVKILESAGVTRKQAEAHVEMMSEFLEGNLATKQDLINLENNLKTSIAQLDSKIDKSVVRLESKIEQLDNKILQSEYRMTIKLGTIVTIGIAAVAAVVKVL
jgi:hypothetical protein